jgi:hypothetical protein
VNGKPVCSCPSYKYSGNKEICKHISIYLGKKVFDTKKPKYQTPAEKAREKAIAKKEGKAVSKELIKNTAYASSEDKIKGDPKLAEFMNEVL